LRLRPPTFLGRIAQIALVTAICLAALWGGLVVFERSILKRIGGFQPDAPGHDVAATERTIRTLDLYPWTGWHVQHEFRHRGTMPWESQPYNDYDVATGRLGFFDHDVLAPPDKAQCERRVVLIGGSGAQGWGARSNADTLARRLEFHLGAAPENAGLTATVVNLAMGASIGYQNFIALNRFGHALKPDVIVSYSGRNDYIVPEMNGNDGFYQFNQLLALSRVVRRNENSGLVEWLSSAFPRLMERTGLGAGLRMTNEYGRLTREAPAEYAARFGFERMSASEFLDQVVLANYVHALKSIRRDHAGVPIAIAWQAVQRWETDLSRFAKEVEPDFYERLFARARAALEGYGEGDWRFVDAHGHMKGFAEENTGTHLGNAGQDRVARLIAGEILPWIERSRGTCKRS